MIILLEGIDRVGKSTLSYMLAKELNCKIFHDDYTPSYIRDKNLSLKDNRIVNYIIESKFSNILNTFNLFDNLVVDRFHLTEKVYNVMRGYDFDQFELFDNILAERKDIILVLVLPQNIEKSSNEHGVDLRKHNNLFLKYFDNSSIKNKIIIHQYDIFNNLEKVIKDVLNNGRG